ncbi:MAG TPA: hypothetical protein VNB23_02160, partial [Ramlibacter sp.]|nr:hypothetical protein [Ramlibacter sp.]
MTLLRSTLRFLAAVLLAWGSVLAFAQVEPAAPVRASPMPGATGAAGTRAVVPPKVPGAPGAGAASTPSTETAQALRVVLGLTVLAILPALLVCLTSFLRIIIVLSMLRHAIGLPETPPNTVLI